MGKYASKMVELARSWVGIKEGSQGHKDILAIYNSQKPLPRGYKMQMDNYWCAAMTTSLAVKLGYTDIVPCECSCNKIIAIAKEKGIWIEDESITPKPGMLCLYDWGDNGKGDNKGEADHIGIVETVGGGKFVVIEGNADTNRDGKDGVERRTLDVNGKNLRGFVAPKYDPEVKEETRDTVAQVAQEVIDGKWSNGEDRKKKLTAAGYDAEAVQAKVNEMLSPKKKTISQLADEVIAGKWGVGQKRKKRLMAEGHDYFAVQAEVNRRLLGK